MVNPVPMYSDFVYGFQALTKEELASYNKPEWRSANSFLTIFLSRVTVKNERSVSMFAKAIKCLKKISN